MSGSCARSRRSAGSVRPGDTPTLSDSAACASRLDEAVGVRREERDEVVTVVERHGRAVQEVLRVVALGQEARGLADLQRALARRDRARPGADQHERALRLRDRLGAGAAIAAATASGTTPEHVGVDGVRADRLASSASASTAVV